MHLRRALLLFAIVLGLAAIAASISREPDDSGESERPPAVRQETEEPPQETVSPGSATPVSGTLELTFEADEDRSRRLDAGQPATVLVEVDEPGLVEIPDLGLSAHGDPLTPARFEVLVSDAGRYDLSFTSVDGDTPSAAGTLLVRAADEP